MRLKNTVFFALFALIAAGSMSAVIKDQKFNEYLKRAETLSAQELKEAREYIDHVKNKVDKGRGNRLEREFNAARAEAASVAPSVAPSTKVAPAAPSSSSSASTSSSSASTSSSMGGLKGGRTKEEVAALDLKTQCIKTRKFR